ncbi:hypothetical protein SISNIDRAFT_419766 [Sistotremastrum niveocremeum HHB9708]|uniref:Uncharacterized protein n=1 Tax=Sistotremastrum niveocremeum HHB9708 TaxID=1314777 RepID=A0A164N3B9_9AGAM|nr:hypothetical protein SISNIDRAFT_419766 [Sistotremastrum niveocremeum HHB9708]
MHHMSLNIPDLLLSLWRGTMKCDTETDSKASWDFAVFRGPTKKKVWEDHGKSVADARPYLPGSFDRPPRNPAEKVNSGYKAWEFLNYLVGLGPGVFLDVLPEGYYRNFCKLIYGMRIVHQRSISRSELLNAYESLGTFVEEFERLYYQRRIDRMHFVRQSIHQLLHVCKEVERIGPGAVTSQWPLERTIGNLGQEIRQPSNPFANLSQRAILRCQINALYALVPKLKTPENLLPKWCLDVGDGYSLRPARDRLRSPYQPSFEVDCIRDFLIASGDHNPVPPDSYRRWTRLGLPNGQIARSLMKEGKKLLDEVRMSRNVKILASNQIIIAEVQYYFQLPVKGVEQTVALVSIYSPPHPTLLAHSHQTLWSSTYQGRSALAIYNVKQIASVVAMVPHKPFPGDPTARFFLVEKPGLDVAHMGGRDEVEPARADSGAPVVS